MKPDLKIKFESKEAHRKINFDGRRKFHLLSSPAGSYALTAESSQSRLD